LIDVDHVGIRDAWCHAEPPSQQGSAIAFQTDWKDKAYAAASASQGWGATLPHLRVRTDIDADGQAKDAALFAYECKASTINSNGQPTHWLFDLDLSAVADPERAAVWAEIEALLAHGLAPLGKTDAHADVSALPDCAAGSRAVWPETDLSTLKAGDRFPLLLVTDALLFTTADIADRSDVDLAALYASAFNSLQQTLDRPDALRYQHHFATQRLAGGGWLHQRYGVFRERPAYQPFVLTEAGSVFVFEVGDDVHAARQVLTHWQRHGLALPATVVQAHGSSWRDHPYLPQNGYGEIAVQPRHGHDPL
jgi:hypothetical protein